MTTVGAFEAKTHLSELLERVLAGEEILITRHGDPVAKLVPVSDKSRPDAAELLVRWKAHRLQMRRQGMTATSAEIRKWINEGRR